MQQKFKRMIANRFSDDARFFKVWLSNARQVGTPLATSAWTGKAMSAQIDLSSGLPVLELGPGTGSITREILQRGVPQEKLVAVEYSPEFVTRLKQLFAHVDIRQGDAFNLCKTLGDDAGMIFDCVISAVPLLNVPATQRAEFVINALKRVPPGRPLVQVTYGALCPAPVPEGVKAERTEIIFRNLPPAHIWTFRRFAS